MTAPSRKARSRVSYVAFSIACASLTACGGTAAGSTARPASAPAEQTEAPLVAASVAPSSGSQNVGPPVFSVDLELVSNAVFRVRAFVGDTEVGALEGTEVELADGVGDFFGVVTPIPPSPTARVRPVGAIPYGLMVTVMDALIARGMPNIELDTAAGSSH